VTAVSFAELVNARRIGTGKWQARCPAHDDRHPSLSITQGHSGVLLKCWSAGCSIDSILFALRLPMSALFDGPQLTPEERANAVRQRTIRDAKQAHQRANDRAARDRVFQLESLVDAIGERLARSPDNRELERLFHEICQKWQVAETELYPVARELGGLRMEAPLTVPAYVAAALSEIGRRFGEVKRPLYVAIERIA
jgi:hypothetical protein